MSVKLWRARHCRFKHTLTWAVTTCNWLAVSSQHSWGPARELQHTTKKKPKHSEWSQWVFSVQPCSNFRHSSWPKFIITTHHIISHQEKKGYILKQISQSQVTGYILLNTTRASLQLHILGTYYRRGGENLWPPAALGEVSVPRLWWSVTHSTQQPVPAHRDSERSAPLQCNCKGESSDRSMPAAEILLSTWENRNQSQSHLLPTGRASNRACAGKWKSPTCTALQSSQAHTSICNAQIGKSHVEGQGVRLLCSEKNTEHKKYLF